MIDTEKKLKEAYDLLSKATDAIQTTRQNHVAICKALDFLFEKAKECKTQESSTTP